MGKDGMQTLWTHVVVCFCYRSEQKTDNKLRVANPSGLPLFLFTLEHSLKAYTIMAVYTPRKGALSTLPYY